MKRFLALLLVAVMSVMAFAFPASAANDVTVWIDGEPVEFDVPPQIINDRTMVPLRAIFEKIGAEVTWDDATKTAISKKGDITVTISIGEYKLTKNGVDIAIDVPAQIVDSRTLVPIRAISESFDCEVFWEDEYRAVRVITVKLPGVLQTAKDQTIFCVLGEYDPITVSAAKYEFYANMLGLEEEKVIDQIRYVEAMYRYHKNKGFEMEEFFEDFLNAEIYYTVANPSYQQFLAENNLTDEVFRDYITKFQYIATAQEMEEATNVTDAEALGYIKENYIRVKHILVKEESEAKTVLDELSAGKSFEELVKKYSLDSMDPDEGYVFTYGTMVTEFEEASYALEMGAVSEPVKSQFGYHIIKKYPMADISDEELLSRYGEEAKSALHNIAYANEISAIVDSLFVIK